jgi:hypothetical protein
MAAGQEAPPPAALREGRSWLCRVYGFSPTWGGPLTVYFFSRRLSSPSALGRMVVLLCGGARFEAEEVWVEELPFPAWGHAVVVDLRGKPVLVSAVREEVKRMLEEYRAR